MKLFDFFYINTYIANNKRQNITLSTVGIVSLFYSNIIGFFINIISLILNYRIFKNIIYNIVLFLLCMSFNYYLYEIKNRKEKAKKDVFVLSKYFLIDILYFSAVILLIYSIYLCNNKFGITVYK